MRVRRRRDDDGSEPDASDAEVNQHTRRFARSARPRVDKLSMPRRTPRLSLPVFIASLAVGAAALALPSTADARNAPARHADSATFATSATSATTSASGEGAAAQPCPLNAILVPKCGRLFGAYSKPEGGQSSEQ